MEYRNRTISALKGLVAIVNDGKEGYSSAAETTENLELKAIFLKYAAQRKMYETELENHIAKHGDESHNDDGGILGALHRAWIDIKEVLAGNSEAALLGAIITGEKAALDKFDREINDIELHADHLSLLTAQRNGISDALRTIEALAEKYK